MKHVLVSLALASASLLPALARADDTAAPRRPTEIVVHMTGDRATLHGSTQQGWSIACEAPCDRALPADGEYWVGGARAERFTLDRDQRRVTLDVNASKSGARVGGIALLLLGSIATVTGATIFGFGAADHYQAGAIGSVSEGGFVFVPTVTDDGPNRSMMATGGVVVGVGLVAAIAGLVLTLSSSHPTTVTQLATGRF